MMLLMGIVAGAGLMWMRNLRLPVGLSTRLRAPLITKNVGNILCLVLIGLTLAMAIPDRQDTPYYCMIDKQDYEAFVWIKDNVNSSYKKAVLDPWKGSTFTVITEKHTYTRITDYPKSRDKEAQEFLQGGCSDTNFLKKNGISIVYTRGDCSNPDLTQVRQYVYLLREAK